MSNGTKAPATETDTDTAIDTDEQHEETALNISADVVQEIEDAATTTTIINHEEYTQELIIQLPSIGDDNITGKVVQWYKAEGDIVRTNDTICDVETDLFTFGMDVEDENEGIMKEILVKEGEEGHKPGTPICIIMHKPMN
jgi:biotin carboxyl carrier protein